MPKPTTDAEALAAYPNEPVFKYEGSHGPVYCPESDLGALGAGFIDLFTPLL
jgi:hypothetical protein